MLIKNQSHRAPPPTENGGTLRRAYREGVLIKRVLIERFYCMGPEVDGGGWVGPASGNRSIDLEEDWHQTAIGWGEDGLRERVGYIELEKKKVLCVA